MTKAVKEFLLDQGTGEVNVEYSDNTTTKYNLADAVTATSSAVVGYYSLAAALNDAERADALTGAPTIDVTAKINAAIAHCEATGETLVIPSNYNVLGGEISGGAGNLTIDGGGTITLSDADLAYGMRWYPPTGARHAVTNCTTVDYPYADQQSTRIACPGAANFAPGDVLFFETRTPYTAEPAVDEGELIAVHSVDALNGYVYTAGKLAKNYSGAGMYIRKLTPHRLNIRSLKFRHAGDNSDSTIPIRWALFVVGAVDPVINVDFEGIPGRGVVLASCWRGVVTAHGRGMKDDASNQFYGYVADAMSCTRGTRFFVYGESCRHPFTTNVYSNGDPAPESNRLWDVGGPRECVISGVSINSTSAAWDTHACCWDMLFIDCQAFWSHQVEDDVLGSGRQYVIQDRGCNTRFENIYAVGAMNGVNFLGQSQPHGQDNVTTFSGRIYGRAGTAATKYAIALGPKNVAEGAAYKKQVQISRSHFEQFKAFSITSGGAEILFRETVFDDVTQMRTGTYNDSTYINCERITRSGSSNEAIGIQNGAQITSVGMKFTGGNVSAMWRGIGSSGQSGTLKRAYTSSTLTGSPVTTSADAAFSLTDTSIAVA